MEANKGYGSEDIQHWDWHEHLRKRPGMYLGKLGDGSEKDDGIYVLFKEIVDNAIDEFNMGFGKSIDITLDEESKEVTVRDYGRGIPLDSLVISVGQINTSGKYGSDAYSKSGGLNGVGAKAVNATSTKFYAQSWRDGKSKWAYFEKGELKKEGELSNCREKDGTLIKYTADPTLYENYSYKIEYLDSMLKNYAYLNPGLTIHFNKTTYYSKNGLPDLISDNMTEPPLYSPIHLKGHDIEVVITHGRDSGENIYSFANGQNTYHGIGCCIFLLVQILELFHSLQSQWGCGIIKSQHVGGDIHEYRTCNRVSLGNIRKQFGKDWTQQSGQYVYYAALLANLHQIRRPPCARTNGSSPMRRYTRQAARTL